MDALALVLALGAAATSIFTLMIVFGIAKNVNKLQGMLNALIVNEPASPKGTWRVTYKQGRREFEEYIDEPAEADVLRNLLRRGIDPTSVTITKNGP